MAIGLLAANLGAAIAYILLSSDFPAEQESPFLWGIGAMFAAVKVAARLVQADRTAEKFATILGINIMGPLRLASLACLIAGFIMLGIDTMPDDPALPAE